MESILSATTLLLVLIAVFVVAAIELERDTTSDVDALLLER